MVDLVTTPHLEVRRLLPADWELLREVRLRALADAPEAFGSTYDRELAFDEAEWRRRAGDNGWFVATVEQRAVGIVAGYRALEWLPDRRALVAMWVDPAARGSGVAVHLVDAAARWAREDGADTLILGVVDTNDRARALYVKCGFVATGQREPLPSDSARHIDIYALDL
jgi:ribosomal protein S18 acetylase RimI-like enzyme